MLRAVTMVGGVHAAHDFHHRGRLTAEPIVSGSVAAFLASLPDWIEPATSPQHRQFFHSVAFGALLGYGGYRAYHWQTETQSEAWLRWLAMIAAGAYLAHLICDAGTPRSLPLLGRV